MNKNITCIKIVAAATLSPIVPLASNVRAHCWSDEPLLLDSVRIIYEQHYNCVFNIRIFFQNVWWHVEVLQTIAYLNRVYIKFNYKKAVVVVVGKENGFIL